MKLSQLKQLVKESVQEAVQEASTETNKKRIIATDDTLIEILAEEIGRLGLNADLNHIDVSRVTNMYAAFSGAREFVGKYDRSRFNGDISKWNVSNVARMEYMFYYNKYFSGDLSKWNVSNVKTIDSMFEGTRKFNSDISGWNVSNLQSTGSVFKNSIFSHDLSKWTSKKIVSASEMLANCPIANQPEKHPNFFRHYYMTKLTSKDLTTNPRDY